MPTQPAFSNRQGFILALTSAAAFGVAGPFGKALLDAGWSPVTAVAARAAIGALVLILPTILTMRGRWHTLRQGWMSILLFGVLGVAVAQGAFYQGIQYVPVGVAMMLEYLGIVLVVLWLWARHGQRPRLLTVIGIALAIVGLALVLDVFGALSISLIGVFWGLFAATGLASYFVVSGDDSHGAPPLAIATGGLMVGSLLLTLTAALGWAQWSWTADDVLLAGAVVPVWAILAGLGTLAAAIAYGCGVMANRILGSKMASFVGLTEVLFAVLFAWMLLGQLPGVIQLLGGAVILTGVITVKLDEANPARTSTDTPNKSTPEYAAPPPALPLQ